MNNQYPYNALRITNTRQEQLTPFARNKCQYGNSVNMSITYGNADVNANLNQVNINGMNNKVYGTNEGTIGYTPMHNTSMYNSYNDTSNNINIYSNNSMCNNNYGNIYHSTNTKINSNSYESTHKKYESQTNHNSLNSYRDRNNHSNQDINNSTKDIISNSKRNSKKNFLKLYSQSTTNISNPPNADPTYKRISLKSVLQNDDGKQDQQQKELCKSCLCFEDTINQQVVNFGFTHRSRQSDLHQFRGKYKDKHRKDSQDDEKQKQLTKVYTPVDKLLELSSNIGNKQIN